MLEKLWQSKTDPDPYHIYIWIDFAETIRCIHNQGAPGGAGCDCDVFQQTEICTVEQTFS